MYLFFLQVNVSEFFQECVYLTVIFFVQEEFASIFFTRELSVIFFVMEFLCQSKFSVKFFDISFVIFFEEGLVHGEKTNGLLL